jgi:molecular chaperone DnaK
MGIAVGIDLGTTNTVVAAVRAGSATTLSDENGSRLTPSIVSFHPSGKVIVGEPAKERRIVDPTNTIYSVKRLIGRTWSSREVQGSLKSFPFALEEGAKDGVVVNARGETYTLPEISAFVLRRAKQVAEEALGERVDRAVITVPANFNDLQRAATKLAGKLAGLEVLRILNEPTAAALAYGQSTGDRERIAVYDLGGGTFDVTLLDLSGNVYEVLATGGDTSLGGDDVDMLIATKMAQYILQEHRVDARTDPTAWATLRARAEKLKHTLSDRDQASIELNDVARGDQGAFIPITFSMLRAELEVLAMPLVARTLETCRFSLETIGVGPRDLGRLILVGGATRMPMVVRKAEEYFGRPAATKVNPDEVVALGAAIQAYSLNRAQVAVAARRAPTGIIRTPAGGPQSTPSTDSLKAQPPPTLPIVSGKVDSGKVDESAIPLKWAEPPPVPPRPPKPPPPVPKGRPDAQGRAPAPAPPPEPSVPPPPPSAAAPLLIDVTPISLGVEVAGGFTDVLIMANTPVPCDRTRVFRTASDGQTAVVIRVAQGESEKFALNTCLGDVELSGLKAASRGEVQIEVIFEIDADGILNVKAKDLESGRVTAAKMRLLGAETDAANVEQMMSRQERHSLG